MNHAVLATLALSIVLTSPAAAVQSVHRVELARGKWFELTPEEWGPYSRLATDLTVVRKYLKRGGLTHRDRHRLDRVRDTLEWEMRRIRLELRSKHQERPAYYPDHSER